MHIKVFSREKINYEFKIVCSWPSLQPMWNSGQATEGRDLELVLLPHWGKAFLIAVHDFMDCGQKGFTPVWQ